MTFFSRCLLVSVLLKRGEEKKKKEREKFPHLTPTVRVLFKAKKKNDNARRGPRMISAVDSSVEFVRDRLGQIHLKFQYNRGLVFDTSTYHRRAE